MSSSINLPIHLAVQIECTSFKYAENQDSVLKDFSMEIPYGKITLISGFSGSGKTTLISLINGIIPRVVNGIFDGKILIDGENISGKTMSQISRKVGSVLQNAESQIINQVVEDEIAFGCENIGFASEKIDRAIDENCEKMQLNRVWKTRTLSGGQKQRVVTASTLAMESDILIFDEPLANLDVSGAKILLDLLKKLAEEGKSVILVEHRLDIVMPYVDDVYQILDGRALKVSDKNAYLKSQIDIIPSDEKNATHSEKCIFELENIGKSFGNRIILENINEKIYKGEKILLCGENGCGKSTLLSIIARLSKPTEGKIIYHTCQNFHIGRKPDKKWFKFCGVVYQNPNYQLFMSSVRDEILFGTGKSNEDKEYALEIAHRLDLDNLLLRHPHSLSEGQKRRVTIAAILAQKPELLLLDEPTVGQDYKTLEILMQVLNQVHKENQNTMISVTHDIRCVSALCDRKIELPSR